MGPSRRRRGCLQEHQTRIFGECEPRRKCHAKGLLSWADWCELFSSLDPWRHCMASGQSIATRVAAIKPLAHIQPCQATFHRPHRKETFRMKWTLKLGAAALMLGITASAPAGLLDGIFSSKGHRQDCCDQPTQPTCDDNGCNLFGNRHGGPDCDTDCTPDRWKPRKPGLLSRICDGLKKNRLSHHDDCCPDDCCTPACANDGVGRTYVGPSTKAVIPPAANQGHAAPTKEVAPAPAPAKEEAAPAPKAEPAPAPPQPEAPKADAELPMVPDAEAVPAPAPPEDAEAYFPSRFRN